MLANWLVKTAQRDVEQAHQNVQQSRRQTRAQLWLLKQQAEAFFRRKDALFCAFLGGCVKGYTAGNSHLSRSSLLSLAVTLLNQKVPPETDN